MTFSCQGAAWYKSNAAQLVERQGRERETDREREEWGSVVFGCRGIMPRALSEESAVGKIIKGLAGFSEAFASKSKCLIGFLCTNS